MNLLTCTINIECKSRTSRFRNFKEIFDRVERTGIKKIQFVIFDFRFKFYLNL